VAGDLYTGSDKDADGKPRLIKTGQNAGQPSTQFFFAVAIPKTPGKAHWAHEAWGAEFWAVGNAAFPKIAESPTFAFKVKDGDSAVPDTKGNKPCEREGYPGNWIVSIASQFAPSIVNENGSAYLLDKDYVKRGYYVQVLVTIDGNGSTQRPGIFVNPRLVSFQGFGPEIKTRVDPGSVGFGAGPKPTGVLSAPVGGMAAPVGLPPALPGAAASLPSAMPAPTAVQPSPGFLAPPAAAPAPLPPPPAAPVRRMTDKAQGNTYEGLIAQGWTEALLIQHGLMVA